MEEDDLELVRNLMAKAIAMLEDAVETAVAAQAPGAPADEVLAHANRLRSAAVNVAALADAAMVIADPSPVIRPSPAG